MLQIITIERPILLGYWVCFYARQTYCNIVDLEGLKPSILSALDPKSSLYINSSIGLYAERQGYDPYSNNPNVKFSRLPLLLVGCSLQ